MNETESEPRVAWFRVRVLRWWSIWETKTVVCAFHVGVFGAPSGTSACRRYDEREVILSQARPGDTRCSRCKRIAEAKQ